MNECENMTDIERVKRKTYSLSDEEIAQAAKEVDEAWLASLPAPKDCHHEFSPEFEQKMRETIREHFKENLSKGN